MKRVIICLMLLAVMLTGTISAHAAEAEITVQVRASATEVKVGDTVEFTVLATGNGVVAMQFNLQVPEGLSYIPNSGRTPENLAQKLGVPAADWTEQAMMFTFYNDVGIQFAQGTEILHFSCVAQKEGEWVVTLQELLPFDGDFMEFTPKLQTQTIRVIGTEDQTSVPEDEMPTEETDTEETTEPALDQNQEVTLPVSDSDTEPNVDAEDTLQVPDGTVPPETEEVKQQQNQQIQEEDSRNGTNWLVPAGIATAMICIMAALIVIKKKRV